MIAVSEKLSLQQLNAEALAGDIDAAILLADKSPGCLTVGEFVERYVPREEQVMVFNTYCDAFRISRRKASRETVELEAVPTKEKA